MTKMAEFKHEPSRLIVKCKLNGVVWYSTCEKKTIFGHFTALVFHSLEELHHEQTQKQEYHSEYFFDVSPRKLDQKTYSKHTIL